MIVILFYPGRLQILPGLYLGNLKDSQDREQLARLNITHVLSIHDTAAPVLQEMTYLCISAADHCKQNLMLGVSRSSTLVVAYLMVVSGARGWVDCLAAVRAARPCAGPNLGFLRQLDEYEHWELPQVRSWWAERYGDSPLNDPEEIEALLGRRSQDQPPVTDGNQ
ncbi:hypothetical protein CRUP_033463 [Coryphaenoides rupestris]|nr:hypothetical protein CRUP_033463 [Coryphaenoides rupestris]